MKKTKRNSRKRTLVLGAANDVNSVLHALNEQGHAFV